MNSIPPEELAQLRKEDKGPTAIAVCVIFSVLALVAVTLRLFTRVKLVRLVGAEDYCIALSMLFSIIMAACQILQTYWGNGKHQILLSTEQITFILKYLYFSILSYCLSLGFTRVSILLQYRRIFGTPLMRILIWFGIVFCASFSIGFMFSGIFTCIPIDAFWDLAKVPTAKCLDRRKLAFINVSFNIACDLFVAALPIKSIWDLQLPKRQKVALLLILTLGWFVCVVSILRLHAMMVFSKYPDDQTWYSSETAYWSSIEVNLAIVCASTPCLKPLVVRFIPAFISQQHTFTSRSQRLQVPTNRKSFVELEEMSSSTGIIVDEIQRSDSTRGTSIEKAQTRPSLSGKNILITTEFQIKEVNHKSNDQGSEEELVLKSSHRGR